jgi:hypothetical protein
MPMGSSSVLCSRQLLRWLRQDALSVSATARISAVAPRPFSSSTLNTSLLRQRHHKSYTMSAKGNYELLCLENPLLDIQGVG